MKRRTEIDFLNTLFCLLVVFVHVCSQAVTGLQKGSPQLLAIYFPWRAAHVVVQGFLFLSALKLFYKMSQGKEVRYVFFIKDRLRDIYLPYAIWVLVYYLYFVHIDYFGFTIKGYLGYLLLGNIAAPLYFVVVIMQFYLLLPLWKLAVKRIPPWVFLAVSAVVTLVFDSFRYSDRTFTTYLLYWAMGCFAGANFESFLKLLRRFRIPIYATALLLCAADTVLSYRGYVYGINYAYLNRLHNVFNAVAILALYSLALHVKKMPFVLRGINNASYQIYLAHSLIITILNDKLPKIGISSIKGLLFSKFVLLGVFVVVFGMLYTAWKSGMKKLKGS